MEPKKPFWQTTSGILIGCIALTLIALLCVCGATFLFFSGDIMNLMSATTPTPIIVVVQPTVPPTAPKPSGVIVDMVMAKDVAPNTFDPIGVTYSFPANQAIFHAVITIKDAPKDTAIGVIWLSGDGQRIGEYELKAEGSRNLDFTFKPNAGKLPPGSYRVDVRLNGSPFRSMNFTVEAQAASSSSASVPASAQPKPSGFVSSVTMAESTQGANKDPVNPTTTFASNATFHAVVRTQNAPANTKFKSVWYAVDVGNVAPPNTLIDETELSTDGTRNIDFTLSPSTAWPSGSYRVEIYVNGVLDTVKTFNVK